MSIRAVVYFSLGLLLLSTACASKSRVLASVNGRAVTQEQFDAYLQLKRISPADAKRRDEALKEYLEREALADAIEKEPLLDPKLTQAELNEFRKEMLINRYFEKLLAERVTDQAVANQYRSDQKKYEERRIHLAHILFRTNPAMAEAERKARLTAAQDAHAKLSAGEDFSKLAEAVSEDRVSGKAGGDLGWIKEGAIDAELSKRAFALPLGGISEPFATSFGYHVIKVLEAPKTVQQPLNLVEGDIRYQLRVQAKAAESDRLKQRLKVEVKEPYRMATPAAASSGAAPKPAPRAARSAGG